MNNVPINPSDIAALCESPPYSVFLILVGTIMTLASSLSVIVTLIKLGYNKYNSKPLKPILKKEGLFLLILFIINILIGIGYTLYQKYNPPPTCSDWINYDYLPDISHEKAITIVSNLEEVQDYKSKVPHATIVVDRETESHFIVQVYEIKDTHTATFNWYEVDKKTGVATPTF